MNILKPKREHVTSLHKTFHWCPISLSIMAYKTLQYLAFYFPSNHIFYFSPHLFSYWLPCSTTSEPLPFVSWNALTPTISMACFLTSSDLCWIVISWDLPPSPSFQFQHSFYLLALALSFSLYVCVPLLPCFAFSKVLIELFYLSSYH